MASLPDPAVDKKLREKPPLEYCLRLAQEMKAFPRKHRLAEFRAEVVVEQTQVLSAALEDSWSKSFRHSDKPKRVDESDAQEIAARLHSQPRVQARMATLVEYPPSKWLLEQELTARGQWQTDHPSEDVYFLAESLNLKGICFSGGGIRSATFNLGVLRASPRSKSLAPSTIFLLSLAADTFISSSHPGSRRTDSTKCSVCFNLCPANTPNAPSGPSRCAGFVAIPTI